MSVLKVRLALLFVLAVPIFGYSQEPRAKEASPFPGLPIPSQRDEEEEESVLQVPEGQPLDKKGVEATIANFLKKRDSEKKEKDEIKKAEETAKWEHNLFGGTHYDLQSLYDSLSMPKEGDKKWYQKLSIRGYTQIRFTRTMDYDLKGAAPNLFGDRSVNGNRENFTIRRARLILSGDVSDHLFIYIQPDFASTPQGQTNSIFFAQLRDLYADVYCDTDKVHRFRVGLSKVPYAFENLQSSQNRIPLDRTDAMNTGVAPNERDLGVIYYWTPVEQQKLFKTLVDSGLKGSGNYGIFGIGVYDGQGGSIAEANLNLHSVARVTWPVQLHNGQIFEASLQGIYGEYNVQGASILPLGLKPAITPKGTGIDGTKEGIRDERAAASFIWYPQPFGFQAEWQVGRGPGLNDSQTEVIERQLYGGYFMGMYRHDTETCGIFTPYARYQQFNGGYRNIANAPFGHQRQVDLGVEWQIRKEIELVVEYSKVNTPNFSASSSSQSYRDFDGNIIRLQFQVNY